jgi:serine/threonine protein kinase
VLAAAEALDEIHSRGVAHGDLRTANIILVPGRSNCLQMMFVDFGTATTWTSATKDERGPKKSAQEDCGELYRLLLKCLNVPHRRMCPLLRALPRQGPILKFLEVGGIKATYEEQFQEAIKRVMSRGGTETFARQRAVETVS